MTDLDRSILISSSYSNNLSTINSEGPSPPSVTCDGDFASLDEVESRLDQIPDACTNIYILKILNSDFQKALQDQQTLLDQNYADKFSIYRDYVRTSTSDNLRDYMNDKGNKHFSCLQTVYVKCCEDCTSARACANGCKRCLGGKSGYQNETRPCPDKAPSPIQGDSPPPVIYWTLNDHDAFCAELLNDHGVDCDWVTFGDVHVWTNPGCEGSSHIAESCFVTWYGYVYSKGGEIQVPDPQAVFTSALSQFHQFGDMLDGASEDAAALMYAGFTGDVITASEFPVFMSQSAVESMAKVLDMAHTIEEAERKEVVLAFVGAILMLVPYAGLVEASTGIEALDKIIQIIGAIGNGALTTYGIVEDPASAVSVLFSILIGAGGGSRDRETRFDNAAFFRRNMKDSEADSLSTSFQDKSRQLRRVRRGCV